MKRLCAGIICILYVFGLSGCGGRALRPVPPALPDSFVCYVQITADDWKTEAEWTVTHGESAFAVSAPRELAGVTVRCAAKGAAVMLDGVDVPLTDTSPFVQTANAYRKLLSASPEGVQTEQGWLYDLRQSEGFTMLQGADGMPIRIFIPAQKLTAVLST